MPNTVKMVAVVDGDEVTVGRCHPGQARILRKQGLAEWREGKVVFKTPPPTAVNSQDPVAQLDAYRPFEVVRDDEGNAVALKGGPPDARVTVNLENGWTVRAQGGYPILSRPLSASSHYDAVRQANAEDIAEILGDDGLGPIIRIEPEVVDDFEVYVREIVQRKAAGHSLVPCDEPRTRMLGFIDEDDEVGFSIALVTIKAQVSDDMWTSIGDPETPMDLREAFKTPESRNALLGVTEPELPEDVDTDELSGIWESAPVSDLNCYVGIPTHNADTGKVEIPVRGLDPTRVVNVAGRAVVGRSPEPRGKIVDHEHPSWALWARFTWPDDANVIGVLGSGGTLWPSMGTSLIEGFYRRVGKYLLRTFHTWDDCWWDVSELRDWSSRYHLVERQKIDRSAGEWYRTGREDAEAHLAEITPSEPEST